MSHLRGSFLAWTVSHATNVHVNSEDGKFRMSKPSPVVNFVVLSENQWLGFDFPEHLRILFIFHSKVNTREKYQGQVFGNLSCDSDLGVGLGWAKLSIKLHLIEIYKGFFSFRSTIGGA